MAQVTGIGCAETALIAAFVAVEDDEFIAAAAGLLAMGVAGEIAAAKSSGPGSFSVSLIDALAALDSPSIETKARIA
jgi:hydroxyethylthiazole kinase